MYKEDGGFYSNCTVEMVGAAQICKGGYKSIYGAGHFINGEF